MKPSTRTFAPAFAMAALVGALMPSSRAVAAEEDLRPPLVVDATGKVVGRLVGDAVLTEFDGRRVTLGLAIGGAGTRALAWRPTDSWLAFHTTDCSGEAFITNPINANDFGTVPTYLDDSNGSARLTIASSLHAEGPDANLQSFSIRGVCYSQKLRTQHVWPTEPPIDLNALYTPPFRVK
jgi:hypothetical protein